MVIPFPAVDLSEKVDKIVSIMNKKIGVSIPLGFPRRISLQDLSISAEKKAEMEGENPYNYLNGVLRVKTWLPGRYVDATINGWESRGSPQWGTSWEINSLKIKTVDSIIIVSPKAAMMVARGREDEIDFKKEVEVVRLPEK